MRVKHTVHSRLRALRIQSHLTQAQLADILSIERATYCNYENEVRTPPIDLLIRLADFYQVSLDYLLRTDLPEDGSLLFPRLLVPEEQSLLSSFRMLSPTGRSSVLQFAAYTSAVDSYCDIPAPPLPPRQQAQV